MRRCRRKEALSTFLSRVKKRPGGGKSGRTGEEEGEGEAMSGGKQGGRLVIRRLDISSGEEACRKTHSGEAKKSWQGFRGGEGGYYSSQGSSKGSAVEETRCRGRI